MVAPYADFFDRGLSPLFNALPPDKQPEIDEESCRARVRRFQSTILPGKESEVMAQLLRDALTYGPFLSDGQRRVSNPTQPPS